MQPSFHLRVTARRDAGAGMSLVELEPPEENARRFARPGQYIWVSAKTPEGEGGYFVLGGAPGARAWEIVIRPVGDAAEALVREPVGATFAAHGPIGAGFPRVRGRALVMAATGGAIAAVRAVVRERVADGDARRTQVFLGVARDLPLADETRAWSASGVEVVICASQESDDPRALPGYVQDHAKTRIVAPVGTPLLLVGHSGMVEAMTKLAEEKHLDARLNV